MAKTPRIRGNVSETRKYIIAIFHSGIDNKFINRSMVYELQTQLDSVITTGYNETEIDIWLESPGGDAHAAYKLWLELRGRAKKLRVWIPDFAKSAATLLVLGADEIYMSLGAELGPLDAQIAHPDKEDKTISALDVADSLAYLSEFTIELAITGGLALVNYTRLSRNEILKAILPFAAEFVRPCVEKIDPHLTRRAVYQLEVAEDYAKRMISERNLSDQNSLSAEDTNKLAHIFVHDYPIHEFVIGRDEAKSLGLPVFPAEGKKGWSDIKALYSKFMKDRQSPILRVFAAPAPPAKKKTKKKIKKKAKKKTIKKKKGR